MPMFARTLKYSSTHVCATVRYAFKLLYRLRIIDLPRCRWASNTPSLLHMVRKDLKVSATAPLRIIRDHCDVRIYPPFLMWCKTTLSYQLQHLWQINGMTVSYFTAHPCAKVRGKEDLHFTYCARALVQHNSIWLLPSEDWKWSWTT